jgi:lipoprotein NlpI
MYAVIRSISTILILLILSINKLHAAGDHPLSSARRDALNKQFDKTIAAMTQAIEKDPKNLNNYSRRGDAYLFRGRFKQAVADYDKTVELNPESKTSHWRRGIAYFYAIEYKKAAHQFEIYNSFDQVDRENGIWRFFSQSKAYGSKKARQGLLKYKKDDRQPFPSVYKLFEAKMTPAEILQEIRSAGVADTEREKRFFYAQLYIGLNYAVQGKPEKAKQHLRQAVANTWGPEAGFGPSFMWHVGRVHYELLISREK